MAFTSAGFGRTMMKFPNWILCENGEVPDRAFAAGVSEDGEPVLVGRCVVEGALTPGKVKGSKGTCYVPFGGQEHNTTCYEILVETDDVSFDWIPNSGGNVPSGAVVGGIKGDGNLIYIGRVYHNGKILPGKVNVEQGCLYVADCGEEHPYTDYEILVCKSVNL